MTNYTIQNTRKLYEDITNGNQPELEFLRSSAHYYIDTTDLTTDNVVQKVISYLEGK